MNELAVDLCDSRVPEIKFLALIRCPFINYWCMLVIIVLEHKHNVVKESAISLKISSRQIIHFFSAGIESEAKVWALRDFNIPDISFLHCALAMIELHVSFEDLSINHKVREGNPCWQILEREASSFGGIYQQATAQREKNNLIEKNLSFSLNKGLCNKSYFGWFPRWSHLHICPKKIQIKINLN